MKFPPLGFFFLFLGIPLLYSADSKEFPLFLSDIPAPSAYSLFANGGWDGNWYVGSDTCWVQKIRAPSKGSFKKAFLGAKLGRAKSVPMTLEKPWIRKKIAGEIFIALSSTYSWKGEGMLLVTTEEIPLEADHENALPLEESHWFWKEIPMDSIQFEADNFIALWSPTELFHSAQVAPILAGGWGDKEINSWLIKGVKGAPPSHFKSKDWRAVTVFEPAIALKLIPQITPPEPKVAIVRVQDGISNGKLVNRVLWCSVAGESVDRAWVEFSEDGQKWQRYGKPLYKSPYVFIIDMAEIPIGPKGECWVRVEAADFFESIGTSESINIFARR